MTELPREILKIQGWVRKAESDFKNAENTFQMRPEECPFDTVCFHAQQLVEKYVKALLVHKGIDFPKTHDLAEIVVLLPKDLIPPIDKTEQDFLSQQAVTSRYPGDPDLITSAEASQAMTIARRVRLWTRTQLPQATLS